MILFKEISALQKKISQLKSNGKRIGFVPTMGALHKGHISLLKQSKATQDITIVSIFVNPTQFNDIKDFEKYPVTIENDIYLLEIEKTDILFLPSVSEMYPGGLYTSYHYELGDLETILEGYYRPGHYQGVCRVVHKFLQIIQPDNLFMGQKDYQQCMVVQKLIDAYNIPTHLNIVPTQREESGLAMSSRNLRLSKQTMQNATAIYQSLNFIKENINTIPIEPLKEQAASIILNAGFQKIDYIEICDTSTLLPVTAFDNKTKLIALTAAFIEDVRLIDNLLLN